jgi:glycosyltransferase involved in cell wall biosynthesis
MADGPPIRVAHCVHGLGLGGAQKVIASIVRSTDPASFRHVVYSCDDGIHRAEIEAAGATVRIVPRRIPKLDPGWVVTLARAMRRDAVHLVHAHLFGDSLHGYLAARAAGGLPVVMTLHIGVEGCTPLQRRGYRWLVARAAATVACSQSVARSFGALMGPAWPVLPVIANGIDGVPDAPLPPPERATRRARVGVPPDELLFAVIGRLEEQKGHRHLLAALAALVHEHGVAATLLVLGDGSLRESLEAQARAERVEGRVVFAGLRPDVTELLPAIDVVVFSSLFEGLPVALLEAMAAGRCIVATDVPGIVEAARPEREAVVVPIGDVQGLTAGLLRVARSPELAARLGEAARRRFAAEFTAARMAERYAALYEDVLTADGARRASRASPR